MRVHFEEQLTQQVRRAQGGRQPERNAGDHQLEAARDERADEAGAVGAARHPAAYLEDPPGEP